MSEMTDEKAQRLRAAAAAICRESVYENRCKEEGISVRFLMRLSILCAEAGHLAEDDPLVMEARAALERS